MSEAKKPRAKKPPEQQVADVLLKATPEAARFLVEALRDDALTFAQRMDSAKEILNRVFGKTGPGTPEQPGEVVFALESALEEYAG